MVKRTGNVQTEKTATGIITTAEEVVFKNGKKHTRWVQIGYTSVIKNDEGKLIATGPYGQALTNEG